ncbi:methylated-DNA--[protein]-cysteine S-methyltransferase [candidate division KSB1 bacterium]|nr:methylated-DNA--[protein]-cysteine S-methyltransferase [candidate division KSB1 bacterium]NIR70272.1 methylated-DNA--[protein]-cysteine S-methyltransferase [candidate division KSB1 bacterium]NIS26542.1 methylated-DNA--[protein]-cysteine S-methyltransferase [candidate division KSB1 bacterium]NIT73305.1 methylated-DNA--[protein]-cysteine S-methyltransferase [candidate division KSB1 bacterium]NIU23928.1 methylated-DNA--[protein]-cysteine S-methyltransferase [candidate division KSB1 bacterium]
MVQNFEQSALDYERVEKAIAYLEQNFHRQPGLSEIAKGAHVSEHHFQKLFSRWVGISPKRFLQYLTKEYAKELLNEPTNLLDVTYETGLSSPGRLHDLFVTCEAVTPGEFKNRGEGLVIEYGIHPSPFGRCMLAVTERGICGLAFLKDESADDELVSMKKRWNRAQFRKNSQKTAKLINGIFKPLNGEKTPSFHLFLKGTNFQIKVWEGLLRIPSGQVVSYEHVAEQIGQPRAARAVANAVAQNPVPFLIPCHRVIRKVGDFGGYQGGSARKKALLGWEAVQKNRRD